MNTTSPGARRDSAFFLHELNKASAVMLVEQGIVPAPLGARLAMAVRQAIEAESGLEAPQAADYLAFERRLVEFGGLEASRLHAGRSRQDIGATMERLVMRDQLLRAIEGVDRVRATLASMAERHRDAVVPAYTWGVQAQPTSFGHYLSAYGEAYARSAQRLREAYARLNASPFGSGALGTSSFPVSRERLAELLGFPCLVVNSFDAVQLAPIDCGADMSAAAISLALTVGAFAADVTAQYSQVRPWITMDEGMLTGVSSIMPQKRNPKGLVMLRARASSLVGLAQTFFLCAHNVQTGMSDYKPLIVEPREGHAPISVLRGLAALLEEFDAVLRVLVLDEARAAEEVDADYSATTELADTLQRAADIPFRIGHHFASELTTYGRQRRLRPAQLPYQAAQEIYARSARASGLDDTRLPLSEAQFRQALDARHMVAAARGTGGPQPAEVARMLAAGRACLEADRRWLHAERARLAAAQAMLDGAFERLCAGTPAPATKDSS